MSLADTYEEEREHMVRRFSLMNTTPALEARSLCLQRNWETSVTEMLAARMGVDPATDLRPGVVAATTMGRPCGWPRPTGWPAAARVTCR